MPVADSASSTTPPSPSGGRSTTWSSKSGVLISLAVHCATLLLLALATFATEVPDVSLAIESLFADPDRGAEEVTQQLNSDTQIAESLNLVAGGATGMGAAAGGAAGGGVQVSEQKIDRAESLTDVAVVPNLGAAGLPGLDRLGDDLGSEQVLGEPGALVEGYGPALDRLTQELARLMRQNKILVVWLFDESESMRDDQKDLQGRIQRVYEELKLFKEDVPEDVMLSAVVSFGKDLHFQTPRKKPTSDVPTILKAIDAIPVDKTGRENTCGALESVLDEYRGYTGAGRRRVVIVLISDESGDDGERVEEVRKKAVGSRTPIYILGRESVFGYLYGHVRWVHPQTNQTHYLPIRRGPETPYAEQLPFDGLRRRLDGTMSGFGPYEQVRLARDTGGIFFLLPNEEQNLNDFEARKYAALDLKEYLPDLESRRTYAAERDKSPFRKAVWEVISLLNPFDDKNREMEIPIDAWYPRDPGQAASAVQPTLARCRQTFLKLTEAERRLQAVRALRDREPSRRWRANYDLILGQLMAYRVRLFQFGLALEQFSKTLPTQFQNAQSNEWGAALGAGEMLRPDAAQLKQGGVTLEDLERARHSALEQFLLVQKEHPNTPWAQRAQWEAGRGYGMRFVERYVAPPPPPAPNAPPPPPLLPIPNL
ncbi:MAG: vWA domain-containing protein [Planctomycetaceae bacterium]